MFKTMLVIVNNIIPKTIDTLATKGNPFAPGFKLKAEIAISIEQAQIINKVAHVISPIQNHGRQFWLALQEDYS